MPAAWSPNRIILFTPTRTSGLHRIPASGGEPIPVTRLDAKANEVAHVAPVFLPDGRRFFYVALTATESGRSVAAATYVADIDAPEPRRLVLKPASNVAYANGHLLFARESTLLAQPFDVDRLELTGEPVVVAEHVTRGGYLAYGQGSAFLVRSDARLSSRRRVGRAHLVRSPRPETGSGRRAHATGRVCRRGAVERHATCHGDHHGDRHAGIRHLAT